MDIQVGDTVYTSGFSSIFPPDIPLGVTGESRIVNGATSEIKVRLFEDFSALRHVTIVENLGREEIKELEGKR
jgi:rod shape-determining protein MreC